MRFWIKNREPDPADDDTTPGWAVRRIEGDPGTDYETSGTMHARAETDGHQLGAAGVRENEAVGESSGARRWIGGGVKARSGMIRAVALGARTEATKRVKALPGRLAANAAQRTSVKDLVQRLRKEQLPSAREREQDQVGALRALRDRYDRLPRHRKGYFDHVAALVGIEFAVVAFDGGALHGALQRAGFSGSVLTYVMVTVPLLIAAVNHAVGLVGGAIGLKLADELKMKAAVAAFVATLGCLVCALIMLAVFRADATSAQNAALAKWASGELTAAPNLLISPSWLGPAQIAGSLAACVTVAFWTMAGEGRELRSEIARAEQLLGTREGERIGIEDKIEDGYEEDASLAVAAADMKVDAAQAQAEIDAHADQLAAKLEVEQGLEEAAAGRLRTSYAYTRQVYRNGNVVRMAVPTITRLGRRYTPPPGDAEGQPFHQPSPNGHKTMSPDELSSLVED